MLSETDHTEPATDMFTARSRFSHDDAIRSSHRTGEQQRLLTEEEDELFHIGMEDQH